MSSQICLKWNSFLSNIATSFESLWEEEGLVDVTLASDGQCLTAHRVILSASSPFFKKVFQTNPCQHPVIILQDVHFSELEALLIFIYKGEVNIEQKNLPALLKAAETLQIRGLSGGDVFAKESYKRLAELEKSESNDTIPVKEEAPKKKQRTGKSPNHSILERALTPQIPQTETSNETPLIEQNFKEPEPGLDPLCQRLELKAEPFEVSLEELQKHSPISKESLERLDTGQTDAIQGTSKHAVTVIAEARHTSSPSPEPQPLPKTSAIEKRHNQHPLNPSDAPSSPNSSQPNSSSESPNEPLEPLSFPSDRNPNISRPAFQPFNNPTNSDPADDSQFCKGCPAYPPFPCPFCDRAYTSWGFRRRHIKAVHTISPSLNCKWCLQVLPTHAAWRRHVISAHNLSASDAHNGLLILEEAHMVLQIAHPTRLDTLVNIIKQSSQQTSGQDNPHPDIDKE